MLVLDLLLLLFEHQVLDILHQFIWQRHELISDLLGLLLERFQLLIEVEKFISLIPKLLVYVLGLVLLLLVFDELLHVVQLNFD